MISLVRDVGVSLMIRVAREQVHVQCEPPEDPFETAALAKPSSEGTILLSHCTENSILHVSDSHQVFPAFSVGKRRRQATCSDVAWIGETHLAAVNLYGGHLRIYRLQEFAENALRLELVHETPGVAAPEGVAATRDGSLLAVSHSLSENFGLSLHKMDGSVPGPAELICKGRAGYAFHGVNFSPDGHHIAFTIVGPVPCIEVIRLDRREITCRIEDFEAPLTPKSIAFSVDGRFVLVAHGLNAAPAESDSPFGGMLTVHRFDGRTGTIEAGSAATYRAPPASLGFIDMSTFIPARDGRFYRILVADQGADQILVFSFDPDRGTLQPDGVFAGGLSFPHGIDVRADGHYVAISTYGDDKIHIARGDRPLPVHAASPAETRSAVKKRVAIVAHAAERVIGGAERSYLDMLAAIDRSRFHVTCVLPSGDAAYRARVDSLADHVIAFPYSWRSVIPCNHREVDRFEAEFRSNRIDLVHVNTVTLLAPLLAASRVGIPSILHARELIDRDEQLADALGGPPGKIEHTLKAQADFIVANSDVTHRLFGKRGRSVRLYNCVDLDRFDRPNQPDPANLKVGIIGTVSFRKGIEDFVALAKLARDRRPNIEFYVIGPRNAEFDDIEKRFCGPGRSADLRLRDDLADPVDAVSAVNIVLSLSVIPESFGRTIAEGMAMRRPVISYNAGAAPELIRHEIDGFLVPPRDYAEVLRALESLADSPDRLLEMGANARARAEELFSPTAFAQALNDFYQDALDSIGHSRALPAT